ncbi:unnamed protein product [Lathyrus sativus]|nr:unnamed protein product [Lathyrus sativus]
MVDIILDGNCNCFSNTTFFKVKNGKNISFWFSKWIGNQALKDVFSELFVLAADLISRKVDAGQWDHEVRR